MKQTLLRKFVVTGHSMLPTYQAGDSVIATSLTYYFSSPQIGDVVIIRQDEQYLLKRITAKKGDRYMVHGDNKNDSKDSNVFGPITKRAIIGKVIYKL